VYKLPFELAQLNDMKQLNGYINLEKAAQYRTKIVLTQSANILNQSSSLSFAQSKDKLALRLDKFIFVLVLANGFNASIRTGSIQFVFDKNPIKKRYHHP
jgi:hypothetical protein